MVLDNSESTNYEKLKQTGSTGFELRTIFSFVDALEPTETLISIDETPKVIAGDSFSPTLKIPDIQFTDKLGRSFSIWYKPTVYYPKEEKTQPAMVDFLVVKGKKNEIYELDDVTKKALGTHEYVTETMIREFAVRLLSRLNPVHMALFVREKFTVNDLKDIRDAAFFLRPEKVLLISEEYLPDDLKINLPLNVNYAENVDMNIEKFRETVRKII
jgi:hypothetical protein